MVQASQLRLIIATEAHHCNSGPSLQLGPIIVIGGASLPQGLGLTVAPGVESNLYRTDVDDVIDPRHASHVGIWVRSC